LAKIEKLFKKAYICSSKKWKQDAKKAR